MEQLYANMKMVLKDHSLVSIRQGAALFLLALISLSFVFENQMVVGGEANELNEGSEKEEDIKEKKLIFVSLLSDHSIEDHDLFNTSKAEDHASVSCLLPEVLTPPPKLH